MKKLMMTAAVLTAVWTAAVPAWAAGWKLNQTGWWYDNGDGTWPHSGWEYLDGNEDGIAECYYFDQNGYCLMNTVTPDGYQVNENGAWVENGQVQTKRAAPAQETGNLPAGAVLVSEKLEKDPLSYTVTADSVYIQDLVDYCDGKLGYGERSESGKYYVRNFSGSGKDKAILDAYVAMLCDGSHNLKLTVEHDQKYSTEFFSWGIDYTGTGNVRSTTEVTFRDDQCTINIYGTIEGNRMKAAVWIPKEMEIVDLGSRYESDAVNVSLAGGSAMAGLYRLADGSFMTSDGRLSTKPGQALVLRDGQACTTEATILRNTRLGRDELWVRDFYRDETLFFCSPANRLMTGDVYTLKDLNREESWLNNGTSQFSTADKFASYIWTLFFGAGHDGDFITPLVSTMTEFQDLTVRVMYWEPDVEAVYYIYAQFDSAPYEIEALCAVNLSNLSSDAAGAASEADGHYVMYVGEELELDCPVEFGTNYELFTWEIEEGSSLAVLSGTISRSCTVTAYRPGTVRLRVKYEYGKDEPDVLTGYLRNAGHTDYREYVITIREK